MKATPKQIAYMKALGRDLGCIVDGDANDMAHVLSVATLGRRTHWASLTVIEARAAITRLLAMKAEGVSCAMKG